MVNLYLVTLKRAVRRDGTYAVGREYLVSEGQTVEVNKNMNSGTLVLTKSQLSRLIEPSNCAINGKQHVSAAYVKEQINNNDIYFILYYKVPKQLRDRTIDIRVPAAFIMAKIIDGGSNFYIDVICSKPRDDVYNKHSASYLIRHAIKWAQVHNIEQVSLSALPQVLPFYPRFGFAHRKSCAMPPDIEVPESLKQRTNLSQKTLDAMYDDDDVMDFLVRLQNAGYGTRYTGRCRRPASKQKMKDGQCADNGFAMRYCLPKKS